MRVTLFIAVISTLVYSQEVPVTSSGAPLLGYLPGPGPLSLTPISGIASEAHLGRPISAPEGAIRIYLPPRQRYALIGQKSPAPFAVWDIQSPYKNQISSEIRGALQQVSEVVFSPRGAALALYSNSSGRLQVIVGMPAAPSINAEISTETIGTLSHVAVSDDGRVVLARSTTGQCFIWAGGPDWLLMPWSACPLLWSFTANSHDVVLLEAQSGDLYLVRQVERSMDAPTLLTDCLRSAEALAVTADGLTIIAADSAGSKAWSINLQSKVVRSVPIQSERGTLLSLRDGNTFAASSTSDLLSLLQVADAAAPPRVFLHPVTLTTTLSEGVK